MCGIFGVFNHPDATRIVAEGLRFLQHRGTEGVGIVSTDGQRLYQHRQLGLMEAVPEEALAGLKGSCAIGHVRYGTSGKRGVLQNVQPITTPLPALAVAHNGEFTNYRELKKSLQENGALFQTDSDTEVLLHLITPEPELPLQERVEKALKQVQGAYSLLLLTPENLLVMRDPLGIRPFAYGVLGDATVFASEDAPFDYLGATRVGDVALGAIWNYSVANPHSEKRSSLAPYGLPRWCSFEDVYFARPDSSPNGRSVWEARRALGRQLAIECCRTDEHMTERADFIIPVMDSGLYAAEGFSIESRIPLVHGLLRDRHAGRSFIQTSDDSRREVARRKLRPIPLALRRKKVFLLDDSLVRGTTMKILVETVREAGAAWVGVLVAAPPVTYSCFYGIDTPKRSELIYNKHGNVEGVCEAVGADDLRYLSYDGYRKALLAVNGSGSGSHYPFCDACVSGIYPAGKPATAP